MLLRAQRRTKVFFFFFFVSRLCHLSMAPKPRANVSILNIYNLFRIEMIRRRFFRIANFFLNETQIGCTHHWFYCIEVSRRRLIIFYQKRWQLAVRSLHNSTAYSCESQAMYRFAVQTTSNGLIWARTADRATRFIHKIFGRFSCCHRAFRVQQEYIRRWHNIRRMP